MEPTNTIKNYTSKVTGATGVTVDYRVTSDATGVKDIFAPIRRDGASLGYLNYGRDGNRCQIFFEPFTATTAKEKKAIATAVLTDIDELLTPDGNE
jgi:hypothetical protein